MKQLIIACVSAILAIHSMSAPAAQLAPGAGTMKVLYLAPMNEGFTVVQGQQGFFFVTDTAVDFPNYSCGLLGNPIAWFGIPRANPSGNGDNPSYRDHVNAVMLAYMLNKPITLWVDGCLNSVPRVVGMEVFP